MCAAAVVAGDGVVAREPGEGVGEGFVPGLRVEDGGCDFEGPLGWLVRVGDALSGELMLCVRLLKYDQVLDQ